MSSTRIEIAETGVRIVDLKLGSSALSELARARILTS